MPTPALVTRKKLGLDDSFAPFHLWRLSGLCSGTPKICRCRRAKENIRDDREQQTVHDQLRQRVKGAEDDVIRDPSEQKPARPVLAPEHKDSTKNREKAQEANPDNLIFKRTLYSELGDMICKSDDACCYKNATDDGN
jgi:hypothetical protein